MVSNLCFSNYKGQKTKIYCMFYMDGAYACVRICISRYQNTHKYAYIV